MKSGLLRKARFLCLGKLRQARNHDKLSRAASTQKLIAPSIAESNNVTVLRHKPAREDWCIEKNKVTAGPGRGRSSCARLSCGRNLPAPKKRRTRGTSKHYHPCSSPFCVINPPFQKTWHTVHKQQRCIRPRRATLLGHMDFHWNFHTAGEATSYVHTKLLTATLLQQPERPAQCFWSTSRKCCKMVSCELRRPSCFLVSASVCHLSTCAHVRKALESQERTVCVIVISHRVALITHITVVVELAPDHAPAACPFDPMLASNRQRCATKSTSLAHTFNLFLSQTCVHLRNRPSHKRHG